MSAVLDASAVLAVLRGEAGGETVRARLGGARICAVNYAECVAKLFDRRHPLTEVRVMLDSLGLDVVAFDHGRVWRAGALRSRYRRSGLSFADCACLALAAETGLTALTGDRLWTTLDHGIAVELFR